MNSENEKKEVTCHENNMNSDNVTEEITVEKEELLLMASFPCILHVRP